VDDLNLTLASGAANGTAANGAGITIDGASATLTYNSTGDNWAFNKNLDVTGNIGVSGTVDGVDIAARDAVLTSTTTTAGAALPKAGGTMTGTLTIAGGSSGADLYINNTSPTLGFTDSNSFSDASDMYIVRAGSTGDLQFQFFDDSANTTTTTFQIDETGNATFAGTISSGAIASTGNVDVAGNITVGNNNTIFAENNIRFKATGASYIDIQAIDQDLIFRTSETTALDTNALTLDGSEGGNATFAGTINTAAYGSVIATTQFDQNVMKSSVANQQGAFVRMAVSDAGNPTYAFEDDTDTGMYRSSSNALAFTTGGVQRLLISSTGHTTTSGNLRAGGGLSTAIGTDFGSQQSFWATANGSTHQAGYTIGWNTGANNGRTQKMYLDNNGNLSVTGGITAGAAGVTTADHRSPAGAGYITYSPSNGSGDTLTIRKYGTVQQKFDQYGVTFPTGVALGDNAHWKIRPNSGNVELVFEYATSTTISDNNIKAKFHGANFGIGTSMTSANPESLIHIKDGDSGSTYSTDGADKLIIEDNDSVAIDLRTPSANQGLIMFSDGTRGVGSIGYAHTNDQLNFKTGGAARFEIDSNGKLGAIYGFSRGAPFPHYYHKRSAQLQAGSVNKKKARVGRIYWTAGHWSAGGVSLHARVGSEYYSGENRLYHFSAQYTDSQVSYQLLESHSKHSNNTRIYLGAVTTSHTYSGQPCKYQDIWVEANSYKRIHVDFTSLGKSGLQQISSTDITSGWGGVVVYDSLQDAADISDFTDELINKDADHFITVSNKVNDTLNQNEYFGFNQIQSGSSLNFNTTSYQYKVPITGVYLFGANVYRNSSTGGNISFRKTDSAGNNADIFGRQPQTQPSGDTVIHLGMMKYCTKGDLVGVFNYGATFSNFYGASDDNFSSFYGHLIKSTM
jgi:hypothetical protein